MGEKQRLTGDGLVISQDVIYVHGGGREGDRERERCSVLPQQSRSIAA